MNQTQDSQSGANSQQRFTQRTELGSYSHHRKSSQNGRIVLDANKNKDISEAMKSSGSQTGLVQCQFDSGEVTKASANMQSGDVERLVQRGLRRRETHDAHGL